MNFVITEQAAIAINKHMASKEAGSNSGLRLGVRGGGCQGLSYVIGAENVKGEDDILLEQHNAKVYIDKRSIPFLENCSLDWVGGLMSSGFKIVRQEKQEKTCGCGESFSI